jgi:hypothetical protein
MALPSQVIGVLNHDSEATPGKIHIRRIKKSDSHDQALPGKCFLSEVTFLIASRPV